LGPGGGRGQGGEMTQALSAHMNKKKVRVFIDGIMNHFRDTFLKYEDNPE
jgi:hypothetical protein